MKLQLQHQSPSEYSGLISFRIDLFDLLTVQVTLKSLILSLQVRKQGHTQGNTYDNNNNTRLYCILKICLRICQLFSKYILSLNLFYNFTRGLKSSHGEDWHLIGCNGQEKREVYSVRMIMNFGDVEYGGTTDKNRGCKKRNTREDDFILSMFCVLCTTVCPQFGFFKALRITCEH